MKPLLCTAVVLLAFSGVSKGSPVEEAVPLPSLTNVAASIRTELEVHGDRAMGKDVYHWSTRLERIEGCRAEFSVRLANNLAEATVRIESVELSLGALDPYGIEMQQKHWLQLPCVNGQSCVFSTSTCTQRSKDGIVTDCTTPSQKRVDSFSLQLDGDAESAQRLQQALRAAVSACRQPSRVTF
jgi:hypothetical protein